MEPTILSGDNLIINKMIPGARIFSNYDFIKTNSYPELWRMKGIRKIRRNDVLVFNCPYMDEDWRKFGFDMNIYYIKRCIALPGDTFSIENGIYTVRGYAESLGDKNAQEEFVQFLEAEEWDIYDCFPYEKMYGWSLKDWGPVYIPRKGDTIKLDKSIYSVYKNLIEYETDGILSVAGPHFFLNGKLIDKYIFKTNYYFMAGDLCKDSYDSRYWGLLPENHIVGKAEFIWKSKDMGTGNYRWNRFFNKIK